MNKTLDVILLQVPAKNIQVRDNKIDERDWKDDKLGVFVVVITKTRIYKQGGDEILVTIVSDYLTKQWARRDKLSFFERRELVTLVEKSVLNFLAGDKTKMLPNPCHYHLMGPTVLDRNRPKAK